MNPTIPEIERFGAPFFSFSNNEDAELLYVSPSVKQVLGFEPDELIGKKYTDYLDQTSPLNSDVQTCREERFKSSDPRQSLRVVVDSKERLKVLLVQTYGHVGGDGKVIANHGLAIDITGKFFKEELI